MDIYDTKKSSEIISEDFFDYYCLMVPPPITIFTSARITANMSATQNPSTLNHGTMFATNSTMSTLIITDTSPNVSILIGSVRSFRNIPIVLLTMASTTATIIAVKYPSTDAPGVIYAAIATASADMSIVIRVFIYKKLNNIYSFILCNHP
jgi:hypothetical protein